MKKKFYDFKSDKEAEDFVDTADLSEYDFSDFKRVRFEQVESVTHIDVDIPERVLDAVKGKAATRGMSYTSYIRELIERDVEGAQ